uniref:Sulfatase N-terminal domain-containing protein n=1 Tax=Plectus sambesii TaxID=2011161 RepID=A0A914WDI9_9BILA
MKRLTLVLLIIKGAIVCAARYKRPNILMIYADDLGWNDVDWHDETLRTPHLRRLAFDRHTVQLDQAYVNQLCSPTRSALMTGHYPHHIGTQKLRDLGYNTYLVGKWHLGYCKYDFLPSRRGFEKFRGYYADKAGYFNHSRDLWKGGLVARGLDFFTETWNTSSVPNWSREGQYSAEVFADESIQLLRDQPKNHPFFLYLAFQSVHAPLEVPEEYVRRCDYIERWDRRIYCGMLNALDEAIGRVVKALRDLDLYENTIIIFSSDNGGQTMAGGNNFPLRGNKDTLWEGGTRTNSFVHSPRFIKRAAVRQQLFHVVDWFSTVLAMAGQNISKYGR